ncbi:MAG: beta-galactosidase trimerization domain-containing protein [Armatimonadota bacterium]
MRAALLASAMMLCVRTAGAIELPVADEQPQVVLPDYAAELRGFDYIDEHPISWHRFMVNAGYGEGRGGPDRQPGRWFDENWMLCDYLDRTGDYASHQCLRHRGIPFEVYGYNEYQETIHFHEDQALPLFGDNGIARDYTNELVMSQHYNLTVESWAARQDFNAYIVCNNAPRWSSVINYDWLGSPLIGHAISQDNIGGPLSRIGSGNRGRYCDFCSRKFFHYLESEGLLPEFRAQYDHIRDYVRDHLDDFPMLDPNLAWNEIEHEGVAAICDDPVMAEYQKFLHIAHAHNLVRYVLDAKVLAERLGLEFDCHGNQAGGFLGHNPYPLLISEFVDHAWFESSGLSQYDIFRYGWHNAHGAMRFVLGLASAPGRPVLCMTGLGKEEPELLEHEYAESCAGGGVLFSQQVGYSERQELLDVVRDFWQFRHDHRAIFTREGRSRHARVAVAYSIPTQMYAEYRSNVHAPHFNDLSGIGRALFEAHIPFDALIFHHPDMRADRWSAEDLSRYRLVILPSVTCIADEQVARLSEYLQAGGTVAVIGEFGTRDENNAHRRPVALAHLREQGRVVQLLDGGHMHFNRADESEETRAIVAQAIAGVREALGGETLLDGAIPRMLWAIPWVHRAEGEELLSVHFVNYDVDFEAARANPTDAFQVSIRLPEGMGEPGEATWLTTDGGPRTLALSVEDGIVGVEVPSVRVYGVLVLGAQGVERALSDRLQGEAMLMRAAFAAGERFGRYQDRVGQITALRGEDDAAFRARAEQLLRDVAADEDERYFEGWRQMADAEGAVLALDFGAEEDAGAWRALGPETAYSPDMGYGWLPVDDSSQPTPEETGYGVAHRYGQGQQEIVAQGLPFWPYQWRPDPAIIGRALFCGGSRTLRIDLPDGVYRVRVVRGNPSWTNRNLRCSGMVRDRSGVRLFDVPYYPGGAQAGEFVTEITDGHMELTFGGPTGWGVSAVVIRPADAPRRADSSRDWRVSPRHPNPEWWPIRQVRFSPEDDLTAVPDGWTEVQSDAAGVVRLGSNAEAETGDVVYAATTIDADEAGEATLSIGASSACVASLNGQQIAYLPNVKGLREGECLVTVPLAEGQNTLMLKLARHWERHWMFYANVME